MKRHDGLEVCRVTGRSPYEPIKPNAIAKLDGLSYTQQPLAFDPSPQTPDKSYRLASGSSDRTIRLWDVQSGQTLHIFEGHRQALSAVAFSPDGQQIASSSNV